LDSLERLHARLDNIEAVQPLLSALRAISLSSRLQAVSKAGSVATYCQELLSILALTLPHVPGSERTSGSGKGTRAESVLLVVGSERGLCGAFNEAVVQFANQVLNRHASEGKAVHLMTLGSRTRHALQRMHRTPVWSGNLSATALPSYAQARRLASTWLIEYRERTISGVEVAYNSYQDLARYKPRCEQLLPLSPRWPKLERPLWPPSIETDARTLLWRAVELWLSATLYGMLLDSAAAEHSARYQLLDLSLIYI